MDKKIGTAIAKTSVVNQVVNQITDAIISGTLKPGDKLPPEPELCETFQVGRNSIREAVKILEAYGVVYIQRPDGTFVSNTYSHKMLDPMLYGILLKDNFGKEIIQLRKVLDMGILQTLPASVSDADKEKIWAAYEQMAAVIKRPDADSQSLMQADMDFHMAVTKAAENELLTSVYSYVERITLPSRLNAIARILAQGETEHFLELHKQLVDIIEGRSSRIEQTLNEHYMYWNREVRK